jgi:pimeloyl-ACP methyl ester carboxylesterase
MPTLVLWGAEDRLRPTAQGCAWMAGLPDGRLELVPATGHLVFEETPSAGQRVTDFLAG